MPTNVIVPLIEVTRPLPLSSLLINYFYSTRFVINLINYQIDFPPVVFTHKFVLLTLGHAELLRIGTVINIKSFDPLPAVEFTQPKPETF